MNMACGGGTGRHRATGPGDSAGYEPVAAGQPGQHGGGVQGHDGRGEDTRSPRRREVQWQMTEEDHWELWDWLS